MPDQTGGRIAVFFNRGGGLAAAQTAGAMPADIAAMVAKARDGGWRILTAREKHAITTHNATLAASLRAG